MQHFVVRLTYLDSRQTILSTQLATTATRLYQAGVDEQLVMERTGHRSLEGVRSYKRTSQVQQENLSDILNGSSPISSTALVPLSSELQTISDIITYSNSFYRLLVRFSWISICGLQNNARVMASLLTWNAILAVSEQNLSVECCYLLSS